MSAQAPQVPLSATTLPTAISLNQLMEPPTPHVASVSLHAPLDVKTISSDDVVRTPPDLQDELLSAPLRIFFFFVLFFK